MTFTVSFNLAAFLGVAWLILALVAAPCSLIALSERDRGVATAFLAIALLSASTSLVLLRGHP